MSYEQAFATLIWLFLMILWALFAIRATVRYELKERKKFDAFLRRMSDEKR